MEPGIKLQISGFRNARPASVSISWHGIRIEIPGFRVRVWGLGFRIVNARPFASVSMSWHGIRVETSGFRVQQSTVT